MVLDAVRRRRAPLRLGASPPHCPGHETRRSAAADAFGSPVPTNGCVIERFEGEEPYFCISFCRSSACCRCVATAFRTLAKYALRSGLVALGMSFWSMLSSTALCSVTWLST